MKQGFAHHWRLPALFLLLAAGLVVATGLGSSFISPERVLAALTGVGSRIDGVIVWTLRLPRVALAVLAGMALALAGALMQRALRNPLAVPSILGVSDGAALGVVTFLWLFSNANNVLTVSIHWMPLAALLGAFTLASVIGLLTLKDSRGTDPLRLILYGVALSAMAKAAVTLMMILGPVHRAGQALRWLTGSVNAAHWNDVALVGAGLLLCCPMLILARLPIRQITLDSASAQSTGLTVNRARYGMLALSVLLTALAVSQVGAIGFVGLIAPHAARLYHGQFNAGFLLISALMGGLLVLVADTLARMIVQPLELPAGAVTALLGTPFFLVLLLRRHHVQS
ncbi:putative siderophore transport system permease protein YfhA (plasmid) [Mameliella alba]|uniref:FecCD family ABC transporter permease n=1 Tax=Mameliella alba TaxID=561184 RepID=UPI000841074E|nr:iron ABC transporter permease [Mameliella alba]ODM45166.1 iron ABC transporter permease [Ruegeria sp. PBVC088]BBU59528.1 putative siderophore transport system permease protein YfhA [Mameliella alba]